MLEQLYNEDEDDEVAEYLNQERDLLENGSKQNSNFVS